LVSPPADAIVPIESADVVYNISGALLYKVKERTTGTFRGIDEDARNSCSAFYAAHSVGEDVARRHALPVDKAVREQFGHDSLTYVSASLYDFCSRLELVYWFNLNLQCAGADVPRPCKKSTCSPDKTRAFLQRGSSAWRDWRKKPTRR
jgi:hypothetical protein